MSIGNVFFAKPEEIDPESYVIANYYVESSLALPQAGEQVAVEESIGTWTEVTTETEWIRRTLPAKVFKWEEGKAGII